MEEWAHKNEIRSTDYRQFSKENKNENVQYGGGRSSRLDGEIPQRDFGQNRPYVGEANDATKKFNWERIEDLSPSERRR